MKEDRYIDSYLVVLEVHDNYKFQAALTDMDKDRVVVQCNYNVGAKLENKLNFKYEQNYD